MKNSRFTKALLLSTSGLLSLFLVLSCLAPIASAGDKMTAEEVVRRHLESIGTPEARAPKAGRVFSGTSKFNYRVSGGVGEAEGQAVVASEGTKRLIGMEFREARYPYERLGYDGDKFTTGFLRSGVRSVLGDFLFGHNDVFKEGLIGGVLTQAWPLLDLSARNPKLKYEGTRKINGKETHALSYSPRKGSDFQIKLFFDAQTFQHVRSEYVQVISNQMGPTIDTSSRQTSTRYEMVEEFSDFRKEEELTLPHEYKLKLLINNQGGNQQFEWNLSLTQFAYNQTIPAESFNMEKYK
jgi:hypothetical protein